MTPALHCWKSINPAQNRYRYYSLLIGRDLWGRPCVVKRWGRLSGGSKERFNWAETEGELEAIMWETHRNRVRHGYRLVRGNGVLTLME